ncbi:hypothetical protein Zmor_000593 [Zophobas morio]|uniref:Uncharacterized protein n=1 Tax=Zophobas morio TaxID=2755281 RepID=A0AA38IZJ5_9CUCU|nr:hypothetical protein Zmor_000593 [Zophobas morio]
MSSTRRWLSKIYNDSQESKTDTDISWSNSDSDDENPQPPIKKRRSSTEPVHKSKPSNWLNLNVTPPKKALSADPFASQDSFLESPIISEIKLEEQSPVLTQTDASSSKEESPVLNRSKIIRKIRWRKRKKEEVQLKIVTEESLDSQAGVVIEDNSTQSTHIEISPAKSELSQPCEIDPFPSQHSSEVISDSFTSSGSDARLLLYHQPPPRKKRYKKGGLASQLHKATNSQSSSVAIWQHEVFLSKLKGEEVSKLKVSDGVQIDFLVVDKWKEYGCKILECRCIEESDTKKLVFSFSHPEIDNYDSFVVVANTNMCVETGQKYQIFPPYSTKVVSYKLKTTLCVIDASRFVLL